MKNGRNTDGTFAVGNTGRPKGSKNRKTLAMETLLEGQVEALTQTAINEALNGNTMALRLCIDRIMPLRKDNYINLDLPEIENPNQLVDAARCVLKAVQLGNLTPIEGNKVMLMLDNVRKILETVELSNRLELLEKKFV